MNTKRVTQYTQDPSLFEIVDGSVTRVSKSFLLDRRSQGVSPRTIQIYTDQLTTFHKFIQSYNVNMMDEITPELIRSFLVDLATHRNKGGVHMAYRCLKTFTYWYEDETDNEYHSPIRKVKSPKNPVPVIPGIDINNVSKMINSCTGIMAKRDKALIYLMIDTGMRASEVVAVNIFDLDMITGKLHVIQGKGAKQRHVFLGKRSRLAMRSYLKTRDNHGPLFVTDEGERMTPDTLKLILRRRARDAGISIPSPHDFRRAFAITCLRNGVDIITLMRLMGHTTTTVLQRYVTQNTDDLQEAHRVVSPADNLKR